MAGRLVLSTLNDDTGVLNTQNGMTGIAKAWVNFNGVTTATIRSSFNVSSVTRNGTGDYTVNFTTAMPNANYNVVTASSIAVGANFNLSVPFAAGGGSITEAVPTTSAFRMTTTQTNGGATDCKYVTATVFSS